MIDKSAFSVANRPQHDSKIRISVIVRANLYSWDS